VISYVTIGSNDIERARRFYDPVLAVFGHKRIYTREDWLGYGPEDGAVRPLIWICRPFDGKLAYHGNGGMVGLHAETPAQVDAFHAAALAHGGSDEGAPGRRAAYKPGYYLAYVRDPDGNKLSAFCNTDPSPEGRPGA
jgi:catechol 2,3-dioxygenase-like lactoylglutathione lyase family enzyme